MLCYVVFADNLDVMVEDPKTQTVNVGENVRFYCRTITAPVSVEYFGIDPSLIFSGLKYWVLHDHRVGRWYHPSVCQL